MLLGATGSIAMEKWNEKKNKIIIWSSNSTSEYIYSK